VSDRDVWGCGSDRALKLISPILPSILTSVMPDNLCFQHQQGLQPRNQFRTASRQRWRTSFGDHLASMTMYWLARQARFLIYQSFLLKSSAQPDKQPRADSVSRGWPASACGRKRTWLSDICFHNPAVLCGCDQKSDFDPFRTFSTRWIMR